MWDKSVSGLCLFAFVRSCQSFQLCGAEEPVQIAEQLLCSCQNWSLMLLQRGRVCRRRGQRSWVHHPTGCFKCVRALEVTGGSTLMWHTLVGAFLLILDSVGRYAKNGKQQKKRWLFAWVHSSVWQLYFWMKLFLYFWLFCLILEKDDKTRKL